MEKSYYKAEPQGGFVRINRYTGGKQVANVAAFSGKGMAQQIARELNQAYAAGRLEASEELLTRFGSSVNGDTYGRGWRDAALYLADREPGT